MTIRSRLSEWSRNHLAPNLSRIINSLAGISMVLIVARQSLLQTPELFPFGEEIGEAIYDGSIAYLTAWLFQLLVIVAPRRMQEDHIYEAFAAALFDLTDSGREIVSLLASVTAEDVPSRPTKEDIRRLCAAAAKASPAFLFRREDGTRADGDWWTLIGAHLDIAESTQSRLVPAYPYLDAQFIAILQGIAYSPLAKKYAEVRAGLPWWDTNVDELVDDLTDYVQRCLAAQDYFVAHIKPRLAHPLSAVLG